MQTFFSMVLKNSKIFSTALKYCYLYSFRGIYNSAMCVHLMAA